MKRKVSLFLVLMLLGISLFPVGDTVSAKVDAEAIVYVSADGKENGTGTKEDPFATIEEARDYLRTRNLDENNRGLVYVMEGTYYVNSENPTVELTKEDSFVTYAAYEDQEVKICGTMVLNNENFKKINQVEGEQYASAVRLPEEMKEKVFVYDLKAENIPVGTIYKNGFNWPKQPFSPELLVDSKVQTLAQYPNSGTMEDDRILAGKAKKTSDENADTAVAKAAGANEGERPRNYYFDKTDEPKTYEEMLIMKGPIFYTQNGLEERIAKWAPPTVSGEPQNNQPEVQANTDCTKYETDGWLSGYFENNYANDMVRIYSVEAEKQLIHCKYPSLQGVQDKRIQLIAMNLLCELDAEGEYYIDRYDDHQVLYYYPEGGEIGNKEISLTSSAEPFFYLEGAEEVEITGISFEGSTGYGMILLDCTDCTISRCEFSNISLDAIKIGQNNNTITTDPSYVTSRGGYRNVVEDSLFHDLGGGGVYLAGGNEQTLEPANHLVQYCEFYNISRLQTYTPAVYMEGVGHTAQYNYIHNTPHMVIQIMGNDMKILHNKIVDTCQNTSDQAPIYAGRCFNWLGNEVAYNYIQNISSGNYAIYMDDGMSGLYIHDNVFEDVSATAIFSNNGYGQMIEDNVFIDVRTAVYYKKLGSSRPIDNEKVLDYRFRRVLLEGDGTNYTNTKENIQKWYEHYSEKYPYLSERYFPATNDANGFTDKNSVLVPAYQVFKGNTMIGTNSEVLADAVKELQDEAFLTGQRYFATMEVSGLTLDYCEDAGIRPVQEAPDPDPDSNPEVPTGDINEDGETNALDALMILKYAAKMETLTEIQKFHADMTQDQEIDAMDSLHILKIVAKLI